MKDTRGRSNGTYARGIMNALGCVQKKKNGAGGERRGDRKRDKGRGAR